MAWCESCDKTNLRKADVEFCYDNRKVLCHGCYTLAHPGWVPPQEFVDVTNLNGGVVLPKIDYAISFDSKEGLKAQMSYGDLALQFHAPMAQIKKYLGPA